MMIRKHLSPALVVALIALFVALSGTAVAAGIVPLAKRALTADRAKQAAVADVAKKLGPQATAAMVQQAGQLPGPASTAAGLVSTKTAAFSLGRDSRAAFTATCGSGEKAVSGGFGYDSGALVLALDSLPTGDGSGWQIYLANMLGQRRGVRNGLRGMSPLANRRRIQAAAAALCALATTIVAAWLASAPGDGSGRLRDARYAASNGLTADAGRAPARKRRSLAWRGGPLVVGLRRPGNGVRLRRVPARAGVAADLGRLLRRPAARR